MCAFHAVRTCPHACHVVPWTRIVGPDSRRTFSERFPSQPSRLDPVRGRHLRPAGARRLLVQRLRQRIRRLVGFVRYRQEDARLLPLSLAPPALKGLSEGVKGYGGSKGWDVLVQDPNFDATKQVTDLSTVINSGKASAAWVLAVAPASMGSLITTAQAKQVPLLLNGKPEEWGFDDAQPGITFDYIDYDLAGQNMGTLLGDCINEKLDGKATVLFGAAPTGTAGKEAYDKTALDALAATAPGAKVVQTLEGTTDRAKAQTDITAALQGHPDIDAYMSSGDEGPLAALSAFAAAGKKLGCDVAGTAGNEETMAAVEAGTMYGVNTLGFQEDMAQSFDTLVKMSEDPTAKGLVLTVPQKVVKSGS
ncbi:MAG: substrate-binding domain-containing protein [Nocardioides sp.]